MLNLVIFHQTWLYGIRMVLTHPLSGNPVIHLLTREANSDPTCCSKGLCPTFKAQQSIHPPYHSQIRSIHHPSQQKSATTHTHISHDISHDTSPSSMDWFSRENLNRKPMGFYHQIWWAFRFQFSHHPILWHHSPSFPHITAAAPAGTVPIGPSFRPPRTASTSTRTGHCFRPEPRRSHGP